MSASNWVHLEECMVLRLIEKAMLVSCEMFGNEQAWIPLSQIDPDSVDQYAEGDENVTISVSGWWAKKNNVECD